MSLHEDLIRFLETKFKDQGIYGNSSLTNETPLLTSRRISSLTLLELAIWIEEHMSAPIDLKTIDPVKEWNTVTDIICFITKHSTTGKN